MRSEYLTSKNYSLLSNLNYFPALTGLRYLAALMVYLHHFNPFIPKGWQTPFYLICKEMYVGVTLFFVLSGFLITLRYYDKPINFKKYLINRFARIYPIYFILTIITFVLKRSYLQATFGEDFWTIFFLNITLLKGFFGELHFSGISQAWSLTVEEVFYLTAPLLFWLMRKHVLLLTVAALFFMGIGYSFSQTPNVLPFQFLNDVYFIFQYTFFGRIIEFLVGMVVARYLNKLLKVTPKINFTYMGLIFLIIGLYGLAHIKPGSYGLETPLGIFINNLILPIVVITPLLLGLIRQKDKLTLFFAKPTVVLLGKSSYVFYLIHIGFIQKRLYQTGIFSLDVFLQPVMLTLISVTLFKMIEEPLNKRVKKILG